MRGSTVPSMSRYLPLPMISRMRASSALSAPETFPAAEGRVRPDALAPYVKRYAGLLEEAARRSPYRVFRFGSEADRGKRA